MERVDTCYSALWRLQCKETSSPVGVQGLKGLALEVQGPRVLGSCLNGCRLKRVLQLRHQGEHVLDQVQLVHPEHSHQSSDSENHVGTQKKKGNGHGPWMGTVLAEA